MKFDCILLAAGLSSRMSQWKLLREYNGKTLLEHALDNASLYTNKIIISGGYRIEELSHLIKNRKNVQIVQNPDFKKGMMTSIKVSLPHVTTEKFFIALGDMPLIPPQIYREMSEIDFKHVLFPVYNGRRGHPVLLSCHINKDVLDFDDSGRMKDLLSKFECSEWKIDNKGILLDVDTDEDYASLLNDTIS